MTSVRLDRLGSFTGFRAALPSPALASTEHRRALARLDISAVGKTLV